MKKILTSALAILMLASVGAASAQNKAAAELEKTARTKVATMDKVIDLTAEQEEKMVPVYIEETKATRAAMKLPQEEKKAALDARYKNFYKGANAVLTPDQLKKWRAYQREQFQKNKK